MLKRFMIRFAFVFLSVIMLLIHSFLFDMEVWAGEKEARFLRLREAMVKKQISDPPDYRTPVRDKRVLEAMRSVPRHLFVRQKDISHAYNDYPLSIGYGQTISQPYIVAYMTEMLQVEPQHRVLEVGTGSGYQAAILSYLVKEVYTVEIVRELAKKATDRLQQLDYRNVQVKAADGYYGLKASAPFDRIIVTAAATLVPPPLLKQLRPGGIMCIPVGGAIRRAVPDPGGEVEGRENQDEKGIARSIRSPHQRSAIINALSI